MQLGMAYSLLLAIAICLIQKSSTEGCHHDLSTESSVRHISYTGSPCSWTIIAPVSQRIVLTLQQLTVQRIGGVCAAVLEVYDEESSATPICQLDGPGVDYISDGNILNLEITNFSGTTSITTIEATFRTADDYFICDFNRNADCTRQVEQASSWIYSANGINFCPSLNGPRFPLSGIFYQAAFSSTTLRITRLSPGKYIVDADVIAGCSPFDVNQAITLTFCNITRRFPLRPYYQRLITGTAVIQCDTDFEAIIQATPGRMVVAMDSIRLMKVIDEIPGQSTSPTSSTNSLVTIHQTESSVPVHPTIPSSSTSSLVTSDQSELSGLQVVPVLVVIGSIVLFLIVIAAFVACILCRKRTKTIREAPEAPSSVNFDNRTYDTNISQVPDVTDRPPEYDAVVKSSTGISMTSNAVYQPVNENNITEGYNNIDTNPSQGYESTGAKDYEYPHQLNEDQDHTYNDVEDQGAYGSPENEYQIL